MGIFGKIIGNLLKRKVKDSEKSELIGDAVDKVEDFIDKKTKDANSSFIKEKITRKGKKITKHQLNFAGTGAIITFVLWYMYEFGIDTNAIIILLIGAAYSIVMTILAKRDKDKN